MIHRIAELKENHNAENAQSYRAASDRIKSSRPQSALSKLRCATIEARSRTGKFIATRVKQGKIQIVEITYLKSGESKETALTGYMNGRKIISALNELGQ